MKRQTLKERGGDLGSLLNEVTQVSEKSAPEEKLFTLTLMTLR